MTCISLSTVALVLSCLNGSSSTGSDVGPFPQPVPVAGHRDFCARLGLVPLTLMPDGLPSWDLSRLTVADLCHEPLLS